MKLLDRKDYSKLLEPLKKVTINNLFARFVAEGFVSGKVYVNDVHEPSTFYILHPYGMSLLLGSHKNEEFNKSFKEYSLNINKIRSRHEWMQAFPASWDSVLNKMLIGCMIKSSDNNENQESGLIELNTRINFKFDRNNYLKNRKNLDLSDFKIVRTNRQIFEEMKGSVVPSLFWDSADDFLKKGIGFSLYFDNKLASTAYSAFVLDNKLELGIETVEDFRGLGLALYSCSSLIDYCLENDYEPVWACRLENKGSYKLAQKLGFKPSVEIPYYRLCN